MSRKNILFVTGLPDDGRVEIVRVNPGNHKPRYKYTGNCDFYGYINPPHWKRRQLFLNHHPLDIELSAKTHALINQVSDADTHAHVLQHLQDVSQKHPNIPIFNRPEHILKTRRDRVYHLLKDIEGVIVPKTLRIQPRSPQDILEAMETHNISFPFIFRACGLHGGKQMVRLESAQDLSALNAFALDGRDYYLIAFIDSSQEGVYHKFRIVSIQGDTVLRHARYGTRWLMHYGNSKVFMDQNPEYQHREACLLEHYETRLKPQLHERFQAVYERIPLDLVGADCALMSNGDLLIFELNSSMLFFANLKDDGSNPIPRPIHIPLKKIKEKMIRIVEAYGQ